MLLRNLFRLALAICIALPAIGFAKNVDLTGRDVVFAVSTEGILSGTLDTRFLPAGRTVQLRPEFSQAQLTKHFCLLVPDTNDTTVNINGVKVDSDPLHRPDDQLFLLPPQLLQAGQNVIRIDRTVESSWAGLSMFDLRDNFELDHFNVAFFQSSPATGLETRDLAPTSPQLNYDVLWYDCTWRPSMTTEALLTGTEVTMGGRALVNNFQSVVIDFDKNTAGNGGLPMELDYVDSGPGTPGLLNSYNGSIYQITVTLPAPIAAGTEFKVRIGYHGTPNTASPRELSGANAYYRRTHGPNSRPVVYTVSQPYNGRRWWPCKDHPSDKATTTIQRIVVPNNLGYTLTAISNGKLQGTTTAGTETTFIWQNDLPIATYLVSMAISDYVYAGGTYTSQDTSKTMPVGHWLYPENVGSEGNGFAGTLQAVNFFSQKFGEYPFLDQKYQTATWNITWAIEHQTCTSMPGAAIAGVDESVGGGLTRRNIHELAHQWFGDKITCHNWDHVWLQEGMATYCEALMYQHLYGDAYFFSYVDSWNPSLTAPIVSSTADLFPNSVVYKRGAWVFHMLRHVLGDEGFFAGCQNYISKGYTTAVSQPAGTPPLDYQTAMEEGAGLAPGSLATFFNQWLYSPNSNYAGRPSYRFSAAYDVSTQKTQIRVGQTQGLTDFVMPVDIRLTAADNSTTTVVVPAGVSSIDASLGSFVPVTASLDPDKWILRTLRANINTASLPVATVNSPYNQTLQGSTDSGTLSWSKVSGASWISVSSGGAVSGTPTSVGTYPLTVRLTNGTITQDADFDLVVQSSGPPPAPIVINEVLYDNSQSNGSDTTEFVELYNPTSSPVDLGGWQVAVVDSTGEQTAASVTIPANTMLPAGDYYVIGNAVTINAQYPGVVDQSVAWSESLPDGSPGAIVLKSNDGMRVDSVTWRADGVMAAGTQAAFALAEGGTGRVISADLASAENVTLSRLPNGADSGSNLKDFAAAFPSPGSANAGITLPFTDNFNSGPRIEWRPAFQNPVRTVSAGAGKPPVASPEGGGMLEVYDSTGGGDINFLPCASNALNVEGYIWLPPTSGSPWSTGIGIGTRADSAWFSSSTGSALEHGYYLEYQNGAALNLKSGTIPNATGQVRLIAVDSTGRQQTGVAAATATILGTPAPITGGSWQGFRVFYDNPANRVYAKIGSSLIYDGPIPAGLSGLTGGIVVGFRENHSGGPSTANNEGTWIDGIKIDTYTKPDAGVMDYYLY